IDQAAIHNNAGGMYLNGCTNCVVRNSVIQNVPDAAIRIIFYSNGNLIESNIFEANDMGIVIGSPGVTGNRFYHNRFVANGAQVLDDAPTNPGAEAQTWDNGYPSGGNFWSDYTGADLKSGPDQNLPGSDGIGDTPYAVTAIAWDNYPLMGDPCPVEDITWGKLKDLFR
ncbi:MAG: NosD domain-containing protein, partial [Gemmatimonadota bacterium]